jgi:phage terminase large subunit-like protein
MIDIFDDVVKGRDPRKKPSATNSAREEFLARAAKTLKKRYPRTTRKEREKRLRRFVERPEVAKFMDDLENVAYLNFVPRPDDPANFDQQESFCYNRDSVSFLIGGNAAGTTEAAAYKTALFVLRQQEPPRPDTPFWILSNTYQQTCATCWQEKLLGHGHIPEQEIDWNRISWISRAKGWPESVPLKPWRKDSPNNWRLEFKSYGQGRQALQARSIGGFWFSEQFPADVFLEVLRGCREYMFKGGQFCEFTPIDPVLCIWVEKIMEDPPKGWAFYRANTQANKKNLAEGWFDQFFASVSDEMIQTRMTGALATFEGVIYPSFNPSIHVVDTCDFPYGVFHYRAIDWGASAEHPFVCLWGYVDGTGNWTIYDEYWSTSQDKLLTDHIAEIEERSREWGYPDGYARNPFYGALFADPSRPDNIAAFNAAGVWVEPAANDVYKGIECVRVALKPRPPEGKPKIRILKNCVHLIDEMRTYRWRRSRAASDAMLLNPSVAAPAPLKRDDDTVDALRYMLYSYETRQGGYAPSEAKRRDVKDWNAAVWGGARERRE